MKKSYLLLGAAGLFLASCSQEAVNGPAVGDDLTTFSIKLPENIGTRTFGDATTAKQLLVSIYDYDADNLWTFNYEDENLQFDDNNEAVVSLKLVKGKKYTVTFFAASELALNGSADEGIEPVYAFDDQEGTLTVNYGSMNPTGLYADEYDCFYAAKVVTGGDAPSTVILYRPVAQICWGTSDLTTPEVEGEFGNGDGTYNIATTFKANVPTTLDLLTGETNDNEDVEFKAYPMPTDLVFPFIPDTYKYIATEFVLAPQDGGTFELNLAVNNSDEDAALNENIDLNIPNAPLKANYQTIIYGALLTENTAFTVTKEWEWNQYDMGDQAVEPMVVGDVYQMVSQSNFIWLAQEVANGRNFADEYFEMPGDVYFSYPYTPIGQTNAFQGNFNGNNHTIHNLVINLTGSNSGLFGQVSGNATIENFTVENVTISGTSGGWIAAVVGNANGSNVTVQNITVSGDVVIDVPNIRNLGTVVGRVWRATLTNLVVNANDGSYISGNMFVGGVVGTSDNMGTKLTGLKSNIKVMCPSIVGGIIGYANSNPDSPMVITNCENTGEIYTNGTGTYAYQIGGIAGTWVNTDNPDASFTFINCNNGGELVSVNAAEDYDLAEKNAIVGVAANNTATGYLYINNMEGNQAANHWQPGVSAE